MRVVAVMAMAVRAASLRALAVWAAAARLYLVFEQVAVRQRKVEVWATVTRAAKAMAAVA